MKNKALTYVLLIAVAFIWYKVFFRVKDNLLGSSELIPKTEHIQSALTTVVRDTFDLKANYRDPFGESKRKVSHHTPVDRSQVVRKPKPPAPKFIWPNMKYFGIVRKTQSNSPLAILEVDGSQLMIRRGEYLFSDIMIERIWRDSIALKRNKENLILRK